MGGTGSLPASEACQLTHDTGGQAASVTHSSFPKPLRSPLSPLVPKLVHRRRISIWERTCNWQLCCLFTPRYAVALRNALVLAAWLPLPHHLANSAYAGWGNGAGNTIYRLREGIERFMITDINNPDASSKAQSQLPIMFDQVATDVAAFNHVPGGSNVLYLDGHVQFERYEAQGETIVNGGMATVLGIMAAFF